MNVIIVIIFVLLVSYFFYKKFRHYAFWVNHRSRVAPRISFDNFKEFYAINPSKWDIRDEDSLRYDYEDVEFETYADFKKYKKFREQVNSEKSDAEQLRRQADFIRDVQKDIDKYRKDALDKMKMQMQPVQETKEEGPEEQKRYTVLYSQTIGAGEHKLNRVEMRGKSMPDAEKCFFNNFRNCVIVAIWETKNE